MRHLIYKILLTSFLLISYLVSYGQEAVTIELEWGNQENLLYIGEQAISYPSLKDAFISENQFLYLQEFKRTGISQEWDFELTNFETEAADDALKTYAKNYPEVVTASPSYEVNNVSEAGRPLAVLQMTPFVKVNGNVRKITRVTFTKRIKTAMVNKAHTFVNESVLREGSGDWYKIKVTSNGVYKIDYKFLKSIGIDVDNIHPNSINIYGNGFGILPELNSEYRPDDLLKNDIYIKGDQDGSFDKSDYILFYGNGPDKWIQNSEGFFERQLNIYANYSVYYINVNPSNTPARIQDAFLTNQPATDVVTDFNNYTIHEKESVNLYRTGKRWYGEEFDAHLSQTFTLNIRNLNPNGTAQVKGYMACQYGGGGTSFRVRYKNVDVGNVAMSIASESSFARNGFSSAPGVFNPTSDNIQLSVAFNRNSPIDVGYLDYLSVNARSYLKYFDGLEFRDLNSVGIGKVAEMQIQNFSSNALVWEITSPTTPKLVNGDLTNGTFSFKVNSDSLRSFVAFANYKTPTYIERVKPQNLHGLPKADYLIVTHSKFIAQAERLANLHRSTGLSVHVVTTEQVYNEFSGGTQDPTAIKFFAKMFYDRASGNPSEMPKYLLLFGDGTYDPLNRVPDNNYFVPMYQTDDSETYTGSIVSDDYFGFLDDSESFKPSDKLDIGVGRLIPTTKEDAVNLVNKIELYMKNSSDKFASSSLLCGDDGLISTHGNWRQHYTVIGDDEENGYFLKEDLEPVTAYVENHHPEMNVKKIYLDAYQQITTAGGERYPEVNLQIQKSFESGTLVTCFVGHGGPVGATQERVLTISEVKNLKNIDKLSVFVSATCEFARVDDNERVSIGEWLLLNPNGGTIALMTTTRAVYFSVNTETTSKFFETAFQRDAEHKPLTFGEIFQRTKNGVVGGSNNKRSFMLIGDPALRIALPYEKVVLDSINNVDLSIERDTIRALSSIRMKGHIEDQYGNHLTNYNGIIQPSIYDKSIQKKTLGQNATSPIITFNTQENILFNGKVSVKNGEFDFEFIVPKDIKYDYDIGKASFYSWSGDNKNAGGLSKEFYIGGIDTTGVDDTRGPEIELYLNDESFAYGGITHENPLFIAKLYDESGINTVGNGIGHDITLIIDENTSKAIVLNDFYESDLDTYKSGFINYQMSDLSSGKHTLTLKAWDINNNSNSQTLEFIVQEKKEVAIDHVLNYPNPFTTSTEFLFEHNQSCTTLEAQVEIFTITGRLVKTINQTVQTRGFRADGIPWNGRDEFGDQLAKGVYIYRISVTNPDGEKAQKMEKLYLL